MTLVDIMTAHRHRVGEHGGNYLWKCFGDNAQYMDFIDADGQPCGSCVFDSKNQHVYEISLSVPGQDQAFLWVDPDYIKAWEDEAIARDINPWNAWDDVDYTYADGNVILKYARDISDTYYDELPIPPAAMKMEMPGTIGGAKIVFPDNSTSTPEEEEEWERLRLQNSQRYMVKLDVRYELEVQGASMDDAIKKAHHFHSTMKKSWGENSDEVCWVDTYVVKETAEREISV